MMGRLHRWLGFLPPIGTYAAVVAACSIISWLCYPALLLLKAYWWEPIIFSRWGREDILLLHTLAALPSLAVVILLLSSLFWLPIALLPQQRSDGSAGTMVAVWVVAIMVPSLVLGF